MITIFNRKLLFRGNSSEEAGRIWSTLRKAGIPYTLNTTGIGNSLMRGLHTRIGMRIVSGAVSYASTVDKENYIYSIYIRSRDLERSKALLSM